MEKFTNLKSIPSYLSLQNIDTDMIIPKQFLNGIYYHSGWGQPLQLKVKYTEGNIFPVNSWK